VLLTAAQCAEIKGITTRQWLRAVERGEYPKPWFKGHPNMWEEWQLEKPTEGSTLVRDELAERIREYQNEVP